MEIIPLFGRLSAGNQQRRLSPSVRRKVVVATNIAETSLTAIPGIRYVVDSGLARITVTIRAPAPSACPSNPFRRAAPISAKAAPGACRTACAFAFMPQKLAERPAFTNRKSSRPISRK